MASHKIHGRKAEYRRTTRPRIDEAGSGAAPVRPQVEIADSRGDPARRFPATEAKNQFARVLDAALESGAVVITKHDEPRAVLLSLAEYQTLRRDGRSLDGLTARFDTLLAGMQGPKARAAMAAAFAASPEEQGKAAVTAARRRR